MTRATAIPFRDPRPVLVVGAGPVGLTSAAELRRRGVDTHIIDHAPAPSPLTKALQVWPRTLEVLRRNADPEDVTRRSRPIDTFHYYSDGRQIARTGFTARTQPVILTQPDVEELLDDGLGRLGGKVERGTSLVRFEQYEDHVAAVLRDPEGNERSEEYAYVLGCDGASSTVRGTLGRTFEGTTYPHTFMLVDAYVDGPLKHDAYHFFMAPDGIVVITGLPGGRSRVFASAPLGVKPEDVRGDRAAVDLMQRLVDERGSGGLKLRDADWTSVFAVHSRHVDRYRTGRVFLLGDAAHIHSPAGGQALNTGVTDAHNLAWKLAMVWHGEARDTLLDTYEEERTQVARAVVRQADLQTSGWMLRDAKHKAARNLTGRLASRLNLFNHDFIPWLAGLRNVYGDGREIRRSSWRFWRSRYVTGALAPDTSVWDVRSASRLPLRTALSDLRHTLLVQVPGTAVPTQVADTVTRIVRDHPEQVDVRVLDAGGSLHEGLDTLPSGPRPDREAQGTRLALVRPDQYVWAHGGLDAASRLKDVLDRTLYPGREA
ncbi:FAD-dependent monooxygenase [Streptomyces sp. NPDC021093]|uniref:FAD-dependent monooxygenase n=1 Tax=Streptomyces sp. NPDC021093 TaxID=3365112 RepID=UPI00378D282B